MYEATSNFFKISVKSLVIGRPFTIEPNSLTRFAMSPSLSFNHCSVGAYVLQCVVSLFAH